MNRAMDTQVDKTLFTVSGLFRLPLRNSLTGLVPEAGLEPALPCGKGILSPLRLPFRHSGVRIKFYRVTSGRSAHSATDTESGSGDTEAVQSENASP